MNFLCLYCDEVGEFETKQEVLTHLQAHEETEEGRDARLSILLNVPREELWHE